MNKVIFLSFVAPVIVLLLFLFPYLLSSSLWLTVNNENWTNNNILKFINSNMKVKLETKCWNWKGVPKQPNLYIPVRICWWNERVQYMCQYMFNWYQRTCSNSFIPTFVNVSKWLFRNHKTCKWKQSFICTCVCLLSMHQWVETLGLTV